MDSTTAPRTVGLLASRDRLESWKEIAAYLNRSERTVRRWEEREGLPVHRLAHDKRGSVYAFVRELDEWRDSRRQLVEAEPPDRDATPHDAVRSQGWTVPVIVISLVAVIAGAGYFARPVPTPAESRSPEAIRLVQLANFGLNAGRTQIETGIRYYQDAIRLDPGYARAWSGLAVAHLVRIWFGEVPVEEGEALARKEAAEAMRLDPGLGQPWRVFAAASHFFDWEHARAETEFRRARELSPDDPAAYSWYADSLLDLRRFDEARDFYRQAQTVSPRWLEPIAFVGNTYLFSGNPDLAIVEYERVLQSEPSYGLAIHYLGRAHVLRGDYDKGIAQLRKSNELMGEVPFSLGDLGYGLAVAGKRHEAEALRADLIARRAKGYYPAFPIGLIEMGLGNTDAALDWIERAVDERNVGFYLPSIDPSYDPVRMHPRFKAVMKRMNLEAVER